MIEIRRDWLKIGRTKEGCVRGTNSWQASSFHRGTIVPLGRILAPTCFRQICSHYRLQNVLGWYCRKLLEHAHEPTEGYLVLYEVRQASILLNTPPAFLFVQDVDRFWHLWFVLSIWNTIPPWRISMIILKKTIT